MDLRERGIYSLPNGRELVVLAKKGSDEFRLGGWGHFELSEYVINDAGSLLTHGKPTAWNIRDLIDTGLTAREFGH